MAVKLLEMRCCQSRLKCNIKKLFIRNKKLCSRVIIKTITEIKIKLITNRLNKISSRWLEISSQRSWSATSQKSQENIVMLKKLKDLDLTQEQEELKSFQVLIEAFERKKTLLSEEGPIMLLIFLQVKFHRQLRLLHRSTRGESQRWVQRITIKGLISFRLF